MLTSQTSSSLLASQISSGSLGSTPRNRDSNDIPEKFKECCVLKREVYLVDEVLTLIVSSEMELIECARGEVTNYLNIKATVGDEIAKQCVVSSENLQFDVILAPETVLFVLRMNSILFGIERKPSQLKLLKTLTNVNTFKLKIVDESNDPWIEVLFNDGYVKLTQFQDEEFEDFLLNKNSDKFSELYQAASDKTAEGLRELNQLSREIEKLDSIIQESSRILPKLMLQDVSKSFV